jgi:rhodanese-related sulfurtransferase
MYTFFNTRNLILTVVFTSLSFFIGSISLAGDKPFAPEQIEGVVILSAEAAIEMILDNPDMAIIDSRKKLEYVKGHIENAVSLLDTEMTQQNLKNIVTNKKNAILFYCNGVRCLRSSNAIIKAQDWGYNNIYWIRGGWKEWSEKRLPVVTE